MSAVVETPAAPIATNDQPKRPPGYLREFEEAEAMLEAAKTLHARATAAHNEKAGALNAVRMQLGNVLNTRTAQAALLAQAQSELTAAVLSGADSDAVRARAQDAETKIDALDSSAAILTKEEARLRVELQRHHDPVGSAENAVNEAELHVLLAKYAALIAPAIPLALEIRRRTNQWLDANSSCLLNPSDRRIGRSFKVDDDGSVYAQMS
jgi:chromosome segregation ATPase